MAAAKQELPAHPPPVGLHNLDTLQSMLNMVLIQSGRFIKEHQAGSGPGRMKLAFQRSVPIAAERWHDALDELEKEVRLAQTVLRRDLAQLKQDRKKREVAAKEKEAEKARLAAESLNRGSVQSQPDPLVESAPSPPEPDPPVNKDADTERESEKPLEPGEEKVPPPIDTSAAQETDRDPLFDGTPTAAKPQDNEFDFDAMFGDAMDTSADNNDDTMDTSADLDFNFDSGSSLLPGLEDFAKDSIADSGAQNDTSMDVDMDMTMSHLPHLNPSAEATAPAPAPTEPPAATKEPTPSPPPATQPPVDPAPTTEATTNNNAEATNNETNNDDLMGGIITDNLDDLFNMDDDYANPEQSSFDDAFFNFE
ncbi:hypothetical protein ACEQ8H_002224 [Pleosporales sp. CAS-2024a]